MSRPVGSLETGARATPKGTLASIKDLYWIAGFLDGEGSFNRTKGYQYKPGHNWTNCERITARQNDRELLDRLQSQLGGRVAVVSTKTNKLARQDHIWHWGIYGARARGAMMTLYPLMSQKRQQQIKSSLQLQALSA
jgi:hypothetical protein